MTLTKADIILHLIEELGLDKKESTLCVESFFKEISALLAQGKSVKLSSFGNFQVRQKKARPGRNPKTGKVVPVAARAVVSFHCSNKLKSQIGTYFQQDSALLPLEQDSQVIKMHKKSAKKNI